MRQQNLQKGATYETTNCKKVQHTIIRNGSVIYGKKIFKKIARMER